LLRNGEVISYGKRKASEIESSEQNRLSGSGAPVSLEPGREYAFGLVNIDDWYDALTPGRYQLTVRKQFAWGGDWVTSNTVYFEVEPRMPGAPIPTGVTVEISPDLTEQRPDQGVYRFEGEVPLKTFVMNNSDQPVKVNIIDHYYGNRPQLFKDGVLIPYRDDITDLIKAKDDNPRRVEIVNAFSIDPGTSAAASPLYLSHWYAPLRAGKYRIVDKRRLEIDGPWTGDSAPFMFEVLPAKKK
jgi:hypothetical protein